jgi:hypothetical protein
MYLRESVDHVLARLRSGSHLDQVAANIIVGLLEELEPVRWEKEQIRRRASLEQLDKIKGMA